MILKQSARDTAPQKMGEWSAKDHAVLSLPSTGKQALGKHWRLNIAVHTFFDAMKWVGLRDRLRCPACKAIGTWKPHGGILDREDTRRVRRWLCKWCGHYIGPEGTLVAYAGNPAWQLGKGDTPKSVVLAHFSRDINPWRG